MAGGGLGGVLPTTHVRRIELRDAKMWRRETEREARTGILRTKCPCSLCLFGKPMLRKTHAVHLRDFGRHPQRRLQPPVSTALPAQLCTMLKCVIVAICSCPYTHQPQLICLLIGDLRFCSVQCARRVSLWAWKI